MKCELELLEILERISNEIKESNRLKRLEIRLKYNIPEFDLSAWDLIDNVEQSTDGKEVERFGTE